MFAFNPWIERTTRVVLITVIVFNALIPTAAIAMPIAEENEVNSDVVLPSTLFGAKGLRGQFLSSSPRSSTLFQDSTPTVMPTETVTETPTPEPFDTLTTPPSITPSAPEGTVTIPPIIETTPPVLENTATPSPTLEGTATSSVTPTTTGTSTTPIAPSSLLLEFSASPYQIKTAD
jgi:hypothetical protein